MSLWIFCGWRGMSMADEWVAWLGMAGMGLCCSVDKLLDGHGG